MGSLLRKAAVRIRGQVYSTLIVRVWSVLLFLGKWMAVAVGARMSWSTIGLKETRR
jgi:hypothetical protein